LLNRLDVATWQAAELPGLLALRSAAGHRDLLPEETPGLHWLVCVGRSGSEMGQLGHREMPDLQRLSLEDCRLTTRLLDTLFGSNPQLVELRLLANRYGNLPITPQRFTLALQRLPFLHTLEVDHRCDWGQLSIAMPQLSELRVHQLDAEEMGTFAVGLRRWNLLQSLQVPRLDRNCCQILAQCCPDLRVLRVTEPFHDDDECLNHLAGLRNLVSLTWPMAQELVEPFNKSFCDLHGVTRGPLRNTPTVRESPKR
jgi:hypothetical protein